MITGVEARQLVAGVSSYGRSFRMTDGACSGSFCSFQGDKLHSIASLCRRRIHSTSSLRTSIVRYQRSPKSLVNRALSHGYDGKIDCLSTSGQSSFSESTNGIPHSLHGTARYVNAEIGDIFRDHANYSIFESSIEAN